MLYGVNLASNVVFEELAHMLGGQAEADLMALYKYDLEHMPEVRDRHFGPGNELSEDPTPQDSDQPNVVR